MVRRFILVVIVVMLVMRVLDAVSLPGPVAAQDLLPTPPGHLGGPVPLPTAESPPGSLPEDTPAPSHQLVGAWLFTFAEPNRPPAQVLFGDDGNATFSDTEGNEGTGVWLPGEREGAVVALVVRETEATDRPAQITTLQGRVDVEPTGDAATLVYMVETLDATGSAAERDGPFTAAGQRVQ